ncbi:acyl-CoA thioesterase II [Siculibacillus lacustris]|uniref:Acyl-CoA thioesterase 2 n=1 Tax=Siculibacillus lacustris TaxID=1549641 RepID=A0A4Q9VMM6_9HYPH|nr:acyl-CoA thioesterase II [Siculibacillus lacustris]TBW36295.1 acyl-CoA thioesterase II [Siculibacillus lacustris]
MSAAVAALLEILDLEPLERDLFRGRSPQSGWQRVFGGQVIGQALVAATRTVGADRPVHSLHGYFVRPGDPKVPIVYRVERIRDGGSFTTRHVEAIQHGAAIFSMEASFHRPEESLAHQVAGPTAPLPGTLADEATLKQQFLAEAPAGVRAYFEHERPIELRPVDLEHYFSRRRLDPFQQVWMRSTGPLPDDPAIHAAVLAYASDMTLLDTALFAHGRSVFDPTLQLASLDHAMWFHRPLRVDDWLLYTQDSPISGGGRGFCRGAIHTASGELVASTAQEGLIRRRSARPDPA